MKNKYSFGQKLFIVFVIGSIIGAYYEEILTLIFQWKNNEPLQYIYRRGFIYGPISPVYGLGAVLIIYFLCRKKRPVWKTFILTSIIAATTEYIISFLQETFLHTKSWDYSSEFLNLNGRTCLVAVLAFAIMGTILVHLIYPQVSKLIDKIPYKFGNKIITILIILITFDGAISMTALFRQYNRHHDKEPITFIGKFCDKYYTDEFLNKFYSNMTSTE